MRTNNMVLAALVVVFLLIVLAGGWYLFSRNAASTGTMPTTTSQSTTAPKANTNSSSNAQQSPSVQAATASVTIQNMAFSPATLTVKKGTTVTWTNKDPMAHTVTENDGKTGPDSGTLDNGATYSYTFAATGTYQYHCAIHSQMTGTVVVTE